MRLVAGVRIDGERSSERLPILVGGARRRLHFVGDEGEVTLYPTPAECAALALFEQPRRLGEALLAEPAITVLDAPREFLAEFLRRGALIAV